MSRPDMVGLDSPTRFVSVHKPELGVLTLLSEDGSEGDVFRCEECTDGIQHVSFEARWSGCMEDGERECDECEGWGWLHGYSGGGVGMPARPLGPDEEA